MEQMGGWAKLLGNFLSGMETLVAAIATGQWTALETSLVEWKQDRIQQIKDAVEGLGNFLSGMETVHTVASFCAIKRPWKLP